MLISSQRLKRYSVRTSAPQPRSERIIDTLFNEARLDVRYFVIDTGSWLPGRKVIIAPDSVTGVEPDDNRLVTDLTTEQIESAPSIDSDAPISRAYRRELALHYGWTAYAAVHPIMGGYGPAGQVTTVPMANRDGADADDSPPDEARSVDPPEAGTLRSANEVTGYEIRGVDESVGHLDDLIVDTSQWMIRYLVIDTVNWLPFTKKVLVPTPLLRDISFEDRYVSVELSAEGIKDSPEFDRSKPIETGYELDVLDRYAKPGG